MKRFLLIGLDGAEPSLVEPWIAQGKLPNLAALRRGGAFLPLKSTRPPATFPAWTSCVTGVNPGRHGIFDFTEMTPGAYAVRFVNSTFRKVPALWNVLSDAGKRVCVLGVPGAYPPEEVNGVMVAGFDSPVCTRIDRSFVDPPSMYKAVRQWRFADFQETRIGPGWHAMALARLHEGIAVKEAIAVHLMAQEPWDFFMVVFSESDTVGHHFWLFHDEASPRHQPGFENAILEIYQRLDAAVGRLIEAAGNGTGIGVVSDHGFGGAGGGVVHLNNWLAQHGYLHFTRGGKSLAKRAALSLTPERWRGALFRRLRTMAGRAESRSRFGGIAWERTRAWSEELNYFPSIRINLKGREPCGQVDPSDYDSFVKELCGLLEEWDCVDKAWRRDELYTGGYVHKAPDIIIELALDGGYSHSVLRSRGGPPFRRIRPDEYLGGKERGMNGNHRPVGVLLLSEPVARLEARIEDVAPTVLAFLGAPAPAMDGRPLLGASRSAQAGGNAPTEMPYSKTEEKAIESRLRGLGYYE
jgi:predicted AlkP superfamily phosphohydrolase/phosphomutase